MKNDSADFRIGEFVNVRVFSNVKATHVAVPNSAITEVNGKTAVFIKQSAEHFVLSYVETGENNGSYSTIIQGAGEGDRIVVSGTYQLKMIYLNQ
jgi:multidrug efflux pump subunit AcrA (membrane-fusion protein)